MWKMRHKTPSKLNRLVFMVLIFMVMSVDEVKPDYPLSVETCPKVNVMKNVNKKKLLGTWYAYATTPLPIHIYKHRCSSYDIKDSQYFKTNILYTDHSRLVITYSCGPNKEQPDMKEIKVRILTRTRTPMFKTIKKARDVLKTIDFPMETLNWLKTEAFCFEWYQLNIELYGRPKQLLAPFNQRGELR